MARKGSFRLWLLIFKSRSRTHIYGKRLLLRIANSINFMAIEAVGPIATYWQGWVGNKETPAGGRGRQDPLRAFSLKVAMIQGRFN
ncbi:hypothetical protein N782_20165 [Pontibacillus yanchengensis Y32]|uniref:Uncharacterized protein n=1 Tax=Pontibacillus yanchengensis Y32 TaxID=1385514 RepID=A0A0A2TB82_9BACI|nr:hypothetical protein N782_20165 [Pontibacillus yanchengensis Y32]